MTDSYQVLYRQLAHDLEKLRDLPLTTPSEQIAWDAAAEIFRNKIESEYKEIAAHIPHEIEHFLCDSDIRFKDANYRNRQNDFVTTLAHQLATKSQQ